MRNDDRGRRIGTLTILLGVVIGLGVLGGLAASAPNQPASTDTLTVMVVSVTDGDTVDIRFQNGSTDTVRLLGVDTPEVYGENEPSEYEGVPNTEAGKQCLHDAGEASSQFMKEKLNPGEQVTIVFDPQSDRRGDYGRLLAYIHDDGTKLNYRLVATGHARVYDSQFSKADRFYAAEDDAQAAERGLWHCRNVDDGSGGPLTITQIHADASGDDNTNLNDEYVTVENTGSKALDLSGWTVTDTAGHTYTVPNDVSLGPGESITLHTGSGTDTQADLYWDRGGAVWNNGGDTVTVTTDTGSTAAQRAY
jgi:micrococcal nuclease